MLEVITDIRVIQLKLAAFRAETVSFFGDRQRDDTDAFVSEQAKYGTRIFRGNIHRTDRADQPPAFGGAVASAQDVKAVLWTQTIAYVRVPQADSGDRPVSAFRRQRIIFVLRDMRTHERAGTEVDDADPCPITVEPGTANVRMQLLEIASAQPLDGTHIQLASPGIHNETAGT
jgi:hypothetical protein